MYALLAVSDPPALIWESMKRKKRDTPKSGKDLGHSSEDDGLCKVRNFTLNFSDIGYVDWIISPKTVDLNYCSGTCTSAKLSYESHNAILRRGACQRGKKQENFCPTCAPVRIDPLSIIYVDESNLMVTMRLPGMIVAECGCH